MSYYVPGLNMSADSPRTGGSVTGPSTPSLNTNNTTGNSPRHSSPASGNSPSSNGGSNRNNRRSTGSGGGSGGSGFPSNNNNNNNNNTNSSSGSNNFPSTPTSNSNSNSSGSPSSSNPNYSGNNNNNNSSNSSSNNNNDGGGTQGRRGGGGGSRGGTPRGGRGSGSGSGSGSSGRGRGRKQRDDSHDVDDPTAVLHIVGLPEGPALASEAALTAALLEPLQAALKVTLELQWEAGSRDCFLLAPDAFSAAAALNLLNGGTVPALGDAKVELVDTAPPKDGGVSPAMSPSPSASSPSLGTKDINGVASNSTLVLKNLPYSTEEDALTAFLAQMDPAPRLVRLHVDSATGEFRGMAFVHYAHQAAAEVALGKLSKVSFAGRPLKAEYKKRLPGDTRYDPPDAAAAELLTICLDFKNSTNETTDVDLSTSASSELDTITHRLNLYYWLSGEGATVTLSKVSRRVLQHRASEAARLQREAAAEARRAALEEERRVRAAAAAAESKAIAEAKAAAAVMKRTVVLPRTQAANAIEPRRQPRGPDGTKGFVLQPLPPSAHAQASSLPAGAGTSTSGGSGPTVEEGAVASSLDGLQAAEPDSRV